MKFQTHPNNRMAEKDIFQEKIMSDESGVRHGRPIFFIDVGANRGLYTSISIENREQVSCVAIEANPQLFNYLYERCQKFLGENQKTVDVLNIAAYNERKKMTLNVPDWRVRGQAPGAYLGTMNYVGVATLGTNEEEVRKYMHNTPVGDNYDRVEVQGDTIDNVIEDRHPNKKIDAIKLDIEGAELFALQGATKILEKHKPLLFFECDIQHTRKFDYKPEELFSFVESYGYEIEQCTASDYMAEVKI